MTVGEVLGVSDVKLVTLSVTEMTNDDSPDDGSDSGSSTIFWVILLSMVGVIVVCVVIVAVYLYIQKSNKKKMEQALDIAQSDTGNDYQKI